jgi:hypothetical protein
MQGNLHDRLLLSPNGSQIYLWASVLALLITPIVFGFVEPFSFGAPIVWNLLGAFGALGAVAIFFGMWRFWVAHDASQKRTKRVWFFVLLFGLWLGASVYCWSVYLPQAKAFRRG